MFVLEVCSLDDELFSLEVDREFCPVELRDGYLRLGVSVGLRSVGLGTVGLGSVGLGSVGLGSVGLESIGLGSVGLGSVGLGGVGKSSEDI